MKQKRFGEAEQQIRFAQSLDAESPLLHEDLGSIFSMQGRFEDAAVPESDPPRTAPSTRA